MGSGQTLTIFILLIFMFRASSSSEDKQIQPRRKLSSSNDGRPGSISIDCGASEDHMDTTNGIFYKSDAGFIAAGVSHEVSPAFSSPNPYLAVMLNTLRSFPNGTKNCYNLKVEKDNNYMIRVFFYYGNYDFQNKLPRFDVYLEVNYWFTMVLTDGYESRGWYFNEIIQFFRTETVHVCLVNTGTGVPIISGLEVRLLNNSIYHIESKVLLPRFHYDTNVPNDIYANRRYEDDVYDRIWFSSMLPGASLINTTAAIDTQSSNNTYRLPIEVLQTAARPLNRSDSLNYSFKLLDWELSAYSLRNLYVYFHFAEIENARRDQRREISITLNGVKLPPITLEYLKPRSIGPQSFPIYGHFNFSIQATPESDLPPILNAFEVYMDAGFSASPTNPVDVDAIMDIKQMYKIDNDDWQGDPCVPRAFSWTGLGCSSENSPRIISLNLSSSNLKGEISPSLSNLTALESLDLSNNELTGSLPEFLAQLPKLKVLNLSGNKFSGHIPLDLRTKSENGTLQLSLTENQCPAGGCKSRKKNIIIPIVGSAVSVLVLVTLLSVMVGIRRVRNKRKENTKEAWSVKSKNMPFSYSEITRITTNFTNVIGEGGFGKVYLGTLKDGTQVAVKVLSSTSKQGYKEFQAEAQLLMIVHHKNLVSLMGYCNGGGNKALVYEYMANGNLRQHLSETNMSVLNWKGRFQIAVDAAHGLDYLHNGCKPPIVHRDMKTSNILLSANMQAKIADFGLSRAFTTESASHVSTCLAGTPGYLDPEFRTSRSINKKSDVYSFGVILLELITGQPVVIRGKEYNTHIVDWVRPAIEKRDIQSVVDPRLGGVYNISTAWKAAELAMSCASPSANQRPDMNYVLGELKECLALESPSVQAQTMECDIVESDNSGGITTLTPR